MSDWTVVDGLCSFCGKRRRVSRRGSMADAICADCVRSCAELMRPDVPPLTAEQHEARLQQDLDEIERQAERLPEPERSRRLELVKARRAGDYGDAPEQCSFCLRDVTAIDRIICAQLGGTPAGICDICVNELDLP